METHSLLGSIPISQSSLTGLPFPESGSSSGRSGADLESSDTFMGRMREPKAGIVQDPRFSFVLLF